MTGLSNYQIREISLADVTKVDVNYSTNETCAKARELFINQFGPVEMMVLSPSLELLLHPENYDALVASGVEKAEAIVLKTPEYANQHIRNLFGVIPATFTGKAEWAVEHQAYYKEGGPGYSLRMEETVEDEDKSLKKYLGAFIGLSHTSVQKLLDIRNSGCGAALLTNIDEGKCSLDRAYKICKTGVDDTDDTDDSDDFTLDGEPEPEPVVKPKNRSVAVLGGNTPGHNLEKSAEVTVIMKFAEMAQELAEKLSETSADSACSIKAHKDRKGRLESYSCTHETGDGILTCIFKPNGKEVNNGNA